VNKGEHLIDIQERPFTVHLLSSSFSGATLLSLLLTANEHIVNLGDTYPVPNFATKDNHCSCGKKMTECKFWCTLLDAINQNKTKQKSWLDLQPYPLFNWPLFNIGFGLVMMYIFRLLPVFSIKILFRNYIKDDKLFIDKAKTVRKARIYCDGSKYLQRVELKRKLGDHIKIIHLKRQASGYLHSCLTKYKKHSNYKGLFYRWKFYNDIASSYNKKLGSENYHLIKYEDLTENPEQELEKLSKFLGIEKIKNKDLDFNKIHMTGNTVRLNFDGIQKAKKVKNDLPKEVLNFINSKVKTSTKELVNIE